MADPGDEISIPRFRIGARVLIAAGANTQHPRNKQQWFTVVEVRTEHHYRLVALDGLTMIEARDEPECHLTSTYSP